MSPRRGTTLVEAICVIAILAVLLALVLSAVQKARFQATWVLSANNLRHIGLGMQGYATANGGKLPGVQDPRRVNMQTDRAVLMELANFIEGEPPTPRVQDALRPDGSVDNDKMNPRRKLYTSPGDPTLALWDVQPPANPILQDPPPPDPNYRRRDPPTSYAENIVAFTGPPALPGSFADGTSNTIAFAERYAICNRWERTSLPQTFFSYPHDGPAGGLHPSANRPVNLGGNRRPSFADHGWQDVYPVNVFGTTLASIRGRTFQVRPRPEEADASVVQTPFVNGLPVAMFDGSVRTIAPGVSETAFWSAVTPAGGESVPLD